MDYRLAYNDFIHINAIVAVVRAPRVRGRSRSRKILQFKHYCTDAPI